MSFCNDPDPVLYFSPANVKHDFVHGRGKCLVMLKTSVAVCACDATITWRVAVLTNSLRRQSLCAEGTK